MNPLRGTGVAAAALSKLGVKGRGYLAEAKPDARDRVWTPQGPHARVVQRYGARGTELVRVRDFVPRGANQGATSSCVGFGVALGLDTLARMCGEPSGRPELTPSPKDIYDKARLTVAGDPDATLLDVGSYPRAALRMVSKHGAASLAAVPFNPLRINKRSAAGTQLEGYAFAGLQYEWLTERGEELWKALHEAIHREKRLVGFAMNVTRSYQSYRGGIWEPSKDDRDVGGHFQGLVDIDDECGTVANSWSEGWGERGWSRIAKHVLIARMRDAGDAVVFRSYGGLLT